MGGRGAPHTAAESLTGSAAQSKLLLEQRLYQAWPDPLHMAHLSPDVRQQGDNFIGQQRLQVILQLHAVGRGLLAQANAQSRDRAAVPCLQYSSCALTFLLWDASRRQAPAMVTMATSNSVLDVSRSNSAPGEAAGVKKHRPLNKPAFVQLVNKCRLSSCRMRGAKGTALMTCLPPSVPCLVQS